MHPNILISESIFNNVFFQNDNFGVTMNIIKAWNKGYTGKNVTICISDPTGVEWRHDEHRTKFVSIIFHMYCQHFLHLSFNYNFPNCAKYMHYLFDDTRITTPITSKSPTENCWKFVSLSSPPSSLLSVGSRKSYLFINFWF